MAESGSYTLLASIVESNNATVAERQLNLALALLTGDLSCYGAINLIREPVFAGYRLQLENSLQIF